jgi:hypothetical protein
MVVYSFACTERGCVEDAENMCDQLSNDKAGARLHSCFFIAASEWSVVLDVHVTNDSEKLGELQHKRLENDREVRI